MKKNHRSDRIVLVCLIVAVLLSLCLSLFSCRVTLRFCKQMLRYETGVVAISESDTMTSIARTEGETLTGVIRVPNTNYLTCTVRSFDTLFTGEDGTLYVICRVYHGGDAVVKREVYACDFRYGVLLKKWELPSEDAYEILEGDIPTVFADTLYVTMRERSTGNCVTMGYDRDGNRTLVSDFSLGTGITAAHSVYTQIGTVVLTSENRICTENGQLYPNSGKTAERLLNGLNLEGDILSFADMTENRLLHLNLTTGALYDDFAEEAQFQLYQNIRVYADGGLTASLEQGSTLVGVSLQDGALVEYSVFKGLPSLLRFLGQTVGFFLLALFLRFVFGLLFLRWKKSRRGKHTIQFFGIASRITAASLLVTLVIISLFGSSIFKTTEEINRFWITSDEQSALRYFSWNISELCPLTEEDKLPTISEEAYQSLQKRMEAYKQKAYTEGKSATESFYWMAVSEDKLYCIYGEEITGTTEAGYLVSLFAADTIQKAMESGERVHFSDNRTIGVQQYIVLPVESTEDTTVQMAVVLETDGYAQKASTTQDFPGVMAVIALCSLLMLLVVNLLLRSVLRRIKKLRTQIDAYEKTGDPGVFVMKGKDEIADTTAALEAMSGTLEVYMKDVTEGNANYSRLISNGILTLLGKEKITQVQPGMCCQIEGTAVRFAFGQCPMASPEQRQKLAAACQEKGGVVVGFCLERMDVFFPKEAGLAAFLEAYLSASQSETVPVFLSYGTLQAGSAGTETNAYLTVTTAIFETIRQMQESTASLTLRCTLEKACQEFLVPQLKRYRCVSVETDSTPLYTIVERENAKQGEETT